MMRKSGIRKLLPQLPAHNTHRLRLPQQALIFCVLLPVCWAVRAATVVTAGAGASVADLLVGMYPGRLNDGEQDFIDRTDAGGLPHVCASPGRKMPVVNHA